MGEEGLEMKTLLVLALMVALLAIRNTAGAGPFGVSMGDPIKPQRGWDAGGYGTEEREYKGNLPFDVILIEGTREGGACRVEAVGSFNSLNGMHDAIASIRKQLNDKYGRGYHRWELDGNSDKIKQIEADSNLATNQINLTYDFENVATCKNVSVHGDL